MISRQVVCNDPRVRELLDRFVPTADFPHRYRLGKAAGETDSLEYRLLFGALSESSFGRSMDRWFVQGMYVITPSGKLIAGGNRPLDVESTLADMRRGLEAYREMQKAERLLPQAPHPTRDRMAQPAEKPAPPADGLALRVFGRGLDGVVGDFCPLKPGYLQIDRLWYTRDEAEGFLPSTLRPGETRELSGPIVDALIRLHLKGGGPRWQPRDVTEARLTSEVVHVLGDSVRMRLAGSVVLNADNEFDRARYHPDLVGFLTYDTARREVVQFDLLAYGLHSVSDNDRIQGGSTTVPYGILFALDEGDSRDSLPPTRLHSYPDLGLKAGR